MPDHPEWYSRIPGAIHQLSAMPAKTPVSANELSMCLSVKLRTAQVIVQNLPPTIPREKVGRTVAVSRKQLLAHLLEMSGEPVVEETIEDRRHFVEVLAKLKRDWVPPVLVEAPARVQRTRLRGLLGVQLEPGRIVIEGFTTPDEARRKLLEFAIAIGNDQDEFDARLEPARKG